MNDTLGDLIKSYENTEQFDPTMPVIVRLDGKAFHTVTKGLERPFCVQFTDWMHNITKYLVERTDAVVGYTQSDEITLILFSDNPKRELYFGGRIQKLCSVLASMATMRALNYRHMLPEVARNRDIMFDCRAFQVPTTQLATLSVLWRIQDAYRNAVNSISQANFSHKQLMEKNSDDKLKMLQEIGVTLDQFNSYNLYGALFKRTAIRRKFEADELEQLPEKHHARLNPDLVVERSAVIPHTVPNNTNDSLDFLHQFIFAKQAYTQCSAEQHQQLVAAGFPE